MLLPFNVPRLLVPLAFAMCYALLFTLLLPMPCHSQNSDIILNWITNSGKHEEFANFLNEQVNQPIKSILSMNAIPSTLFIPIDEEIKRTSRRDWLNSHLILKAYDANELLKLESMPPFGQNKPSLGFSYGYNSTTGGSVYVLDAKIIESHKVGPSWVHIIDKVLEVPSMTSAVAPSGIEFINFPSQYQPSYLENTQFSALINRTGSEQSFSDCTACTFFVPLRISDYTRGKIDKQVLLGHVVGNLALYSSSMNLSMPYVTKAVSNELSVNLTKQVRIASNGQKIVYINAIAKGKTNDGMKLGNTRAKVIRGDIPVKNGVVHIIDKPLITTDITTADYLREEGQDSLKEFFSLVNNLRATQEVFSRGDPDSPVTVFAFTNEAYEAVKDDLDYIRRENTSLYEDLLKLHFLDGRIVNSHNAEQVKEYTSLATNRKLSFSVSDERLYVEGEGVKAAAVLQDIVATNGVIHIINKVLGIPSSPIKDKLREDPKLHTTFRVSTRGNTNWIDKLGDRARNITFFAPSEEAWAKLKIENPSAYKQLTEGFYLPNTERILNRHLVLNRAISLDGLAKSSDIETVNSKLHVENSTSQQEVVIKYMQTRAKVTRKDIKAINGIIHEIDTILMQDADLEVSPEMARSDPNSSSRLYLNSSLLILLFIVISLY